MSDLPIGIELQTVVFFYRPGHAILDGIKPTIVSEGLLEGLALTESFADLAAVFGVLDQVSEYLNTRVNITFRQVDF